MSRSRYTQRRRESITLKQYRAEEWTRRAIQASLFELIEKLQRPLTPGDTVGTCTCPPGHENGGFCVKGCPACPELPWHCPRLRTPTE